MGRFTFVLTLALVAGPLPAQQDVGPAAPTSQPISDGSSNRSHVRDAFERLSSAGSSGRAKEKGLKMPIPALLAGDLKSDERREDALAVMRDAKLVPPDWILLHLKEGCFKPLEKAKQYDLIADLCDRGLSGDLSSLSVQDHPVILISSMAYCRAEAMLAAGRADEALSAAKSYYNTCRLEETRDAIRLISEILINSREKTEPGIVERFRKQQVALSQAPASVDGPPVALPPELGENLLTTIKVDGHPYDAALQRAAAGPITYKSLRTQGDLLLMADRPKDARKAFETAADLAPQDSLSNAIQSIARSIRAEDGSVGRANAYILSLRKSGGAGHDQAAKPQRDDK